MNSIKWLGQGYTHRFPQTRFFARRPKGVHQNLRWRNRTCHPTCPISSSEKLGASESTYIRREQKRREPQRCLGKTLLQGPSGTKILEFCSLKWCILV